MTIEPYPDDSYTSPRISFSWDFCETDTLAPIRSSSTESGSSNNLDFCFDSSSIYKEPPSADELFLHGKIIPFEIKRKEECPEQMHTPRLSLHGLPLSASPPHTISTGNNYANKNSRHEGSTGIPRNEADHGNNTNQEEPLEPVEQFLDGRFLPPDINKAIPFAPLGAFLQASGFGEDLWQEESRKTAGKKVMQNLKPKLPHPCPPLGAFLEAERFNEDLKHEKTKKNKTASNAMNPWKQNPEAFRGFKRSGNWNCAIYGGRLFHFLVVDRSNSTGSSPYRLAKEGKSHKQKSQNLKPWQSFSPTSY